MKRNLFAIFLALALVVALAFVVAPNAQAETMTVVQATGHGKMTVAEGQILDLNGYNVEVETNGTISVINTSFITESGLLLGGNHPGSLTITGNGSPKPVATDGKFQYLAVATTVEGVTTYNFHPFNLGITKLGLNTLGKNGENPAVCIEVMFIANDVVKAKLESDENNYGLEKLSGSTTGLISAKDNDDDYDNYLFNGANGVKAYYDLSGSLTDHIDKTYEFQAYIKFDGIDKITNNPITFIPREVLKGINKGIALNEGEDKITPSPAQKDRIVALLDTNTRLSNIFRYYAEGSSATITFDDTSKRSDDKKVWTENDIVVTYDGTTNDYSNPVRFYANSKVTVDFNGMNTIVFDCNSDSYAQTLSTSIGTVSGATVTTSSDKVTVTFNEAVNTFSITKLSAQVRVDSIEVSAGTPCTHEKKSTPTCSSPAKCLDCDENFAGTEIDCVDNNGDKFCDSCGIPIPDSTLTLEQATSLGLSMEHNTYTEGKYYIEGVIVDVSAEYGNMTIEDGEGNQFYIYGTSKNGTSYGNLTVKPVNGDKVTVYGVIGKYNENAQMKSGQITNVDVLHDHDYTEVTCVADATCTICGATGETATGHSTDSGTCEYCGEQIGGTTEQKWTLVTNVNQLVAGKQIIIVAKDSAVALSTTQNSNNRGQTAIDKSAPITLSDSVQVLTLETGKASGTFAFYTGSGYLYAASSSKNYLRTETSMSDNSSWKITINASTGAATIVAQGSNTKNTLQYNKNSSIFSCYSTTQQAVQIYVYE